MKIIANVPVRNEAWILRTVLEALQVLVDVIVVADQQSCDGTAKICAQFPKVVRLVNSQSTFDEQAMRQLLLDASRDWNGQNLILTVDADEVFTADILDKELFNQLVDGTPVGSAAALRWVWLWKDPAHYRVDGPRFAENWKYCAFRDDRRLTFEPGLIHRPRVPGEAARREVRFERPRMLHYQFAHWERALAKQRWYRCFERLAYPSKPSEAINVMYAWFLGGWTPPRLREVPDAWLQRWRDFNVEPGAFVRESFFWYEVEVLRLFGERGVEPFADLDIWDVDWEERRQAAIHAGYLDMPARPIHDPRSAEQRVAQIFTRRTLHVPPWRSVTRLTSSLNARLRSSPGGS